MYSKNTLITCVQYYKHSEVMRWFVWIQFTAYLPLSTKCCDTRGFKSLTRNVIDSQENMTFYMHLMCFLVFSGVWYCMEKSSSDILPVTQHRGNMLFSAESYKSEVCLLYSNLSMGRSAGVSVYCWVGDGEICSWQPIWACKVERLSSPNREAVWWVLSQLASTQCLWVLKR